MIEAFPEFTSDFNFLILVRLAAAALLGGIIGFERSGNRHEAGLRTHIIVCLGAAGVMVTGELLSVKYGSDVTRMSAQVISGVGFLGAGSIIMDGSRIRGITTAAGIWTTACVGLVVGAGYYIVAVFIVALMMCAMLGLRSVTKKLQEKSQRHVLKIEYRKKDTIKNVLNILLDESAVIKTVNFEGTEGEESSVLIEFTIPDNINFETLIVNIVTMDNVLSVIPHTGF